MKQTKITIVDYKLRIFFKLSRVVRSLLKFMNISFRQGTE